MKFSGVQVQREPGIDSAESADSLPEDVLFEVLANPRRRHVLRALSAGETYEIRSLAETVAAAENHTTVDDISREDRKSAYTALQQLHLPKLQTAGLIVYDKDRGKVVPTSAIEAVERYLSCTRGEGVPWLRYYSMLSVVGLTLLVLAWFDAPLLGRLPELAWVTVLVFGFLVPPVVTYRTRARNRAEED